MRIAAVLVLVGACYAPSPPDCAYRCAANDCPSGFSCDGEQFCRIGEVTKSCTVQQGSGDSGGSCWPYAPSNVDPCAATFPPSIGPLDITTDRPLDTNNPDIGVLGTDTVLLHVDRLGVATGKKLLVTGGRWLIIVSDADAVIDGTIEMTANVIGASAPCNAGNGQGSFSTHIGPGGGGGGFGLRGGNGGIASSAPEAAAGTPNGDATLVPLRGGCNGGAGGDGGQPSGSGGAGGGALQISARGAVRVGGLISANGAGGTPGLSGLCASTNCSSGGGGGGSGGAVLLEAMTIDIRAGASVCAVGGAGGGGGLGGSAAGANGGFGGGGMGCVAGTAGIGGAPGGEGGDLSPASDGTDTAMAGASSGGGGGSVGRIQLRAIAMTASIEGTTVP